MNRRMFIQSVFVTTVACVGAASAAGTSAGLAGDQTIFTLYDPRFFKSRAAAELLAPRSTLRPIAGDVSELVPILLSTEARSAPIDVAGVTTESVPFCLEQLLSFSHQPVLEMRRLDADLFAWTLKFVRRTPGVVRL